MRIVVRAHPGAKKPYVKEMGDPLFGSKGKRELKVAVSEPAREGKANRAIEKAIAAYFRVPPSRVSIVTGHAARIKIVELSQPDKS